MKTSICNTLIVMAVLATVLCNTSYAAQMNVTGTPFEVILDTPVVIVTQPLSQTVTPGTNVTFTVVVSAASTTPLNYAWTKNGAPIPTATTSVLSLPAVTGADAANYQVTVSNSVNAVLSDIAHLQVGTALAVTITISDSSPNPNDTVNFTSLVSGGAGGNTYQWRRNGANISGATGSTYTLQASTSLDGDYTLRVIDSASATATSNPVNMLTNVAVSITTQPQSVTGVMIGQGAAFSVVAAGTAPITYQWYHGGVAIPGATAATYAIAAVAAGDAGGYYVIVNNMVNQPVQSNTAMLVILNQLTVDISTVPMYDVNRQVHVNPVGNNAPTQIDCTATVGGGTLPYFYQWTRNGVDIPGATSSTVTILGTPATVGTISIKVHDSTP